MKNRFVVFAVWQLLISTAAFAARPALPEGWRLPEWWDLDGKDRSFLMADFNGDGASDMATLAVRDDSDIVALLVWYAGAQGKERWIVVDQRKRPQSLSNLRFETVTDDAHPKYADIRLCMASNECHVFSWDEQTRALKRILHPRKSAK